MIQKELSKEKALAKAQNICAKQEKCKADIKQKLYDWKVNTKDHEWVLQNLVKDKFIDENRFIEFFVRDKFRLNKWGKIKIEFALKAKQIPDEIIKESLDKINQEEYFNACNELLVKKFKTLTKEEPYKMKEKLLRFAQSRGFEAGIVFKIVDKLIK